MRLLLEKLLDILEAVLRFRHRRDVYKRQDYLIGPRYFHNQTLATSETCLSSGLWGSSDYFYLKPFSTNGFVASIDRKSTRLNSSHEFVSRMPSSAR